MQPALIRTGSGFFDTGFRAAFALAARAMYSDPKVSARDIVQRSPEIAADICVYTNKNISIVEPV